MMPGEKRFLEKSIEGLLFGAVGNAGKHQRLTRDFIRRTSKNLGAMYDAGIQDGAEGKELVAEEQLMTAHSDSDFSKSFLHLAYTAYFSGYQIGTLQRK